MPDRIKFRRLFNSKKISWLLQDEFNDARTGGNVNNTFASDGKNKRTVTDGNSVMSVVPSLLNFSTGGVAAGNPGIWYPSFTRQLGRFLVADITPTAPATDQAAVGWDIDQTGAVSDSIRFRASGSLDIAQNAATAWSTGMTFTANNYKVCLDQRSIGMQYFIKGGIWLNWRWLWTSSLGNGSLFPGIIGRSTTAVFTNDFIRIPNTLWIPLVEASDSFNRTNGSAGVTDGAGHAEANSGAGLTWNGNGAISGNALQITPTQGSELNVGNIVVGMWYLITATEANHFYTACAVNDTFVALATTGLDSNNKVKPLTLVTQLAAVNVSTTDIVVDIEVSVLTTRTQAGLIARLDSITNPQNYLIAYFNGAGKLLVDQCIGGTYTNVIPAATKAFTASDHLILDIEGTSVRFYHVTAAGTSTYEGTFTTAVTTGTLVGAFTTDASSLFNSFVVKATGTEGEHNLLNEFIK